MDENGGIYILFIIYLLLFNFFPSRYEPIKADKSR